MSGYRHLYYRSADGLRLHARDYGGGGVPLVCVPGLTRNARDFRDVAERVSAAGRRVLCVDLRGRGMSAYDTRPANYTPKQESADVLCLLEEEGIERVGVLGTSRGGLVAMCMAKARGSVLGGVVLNDVGPEVEEGALEVIGEKARVLSVLPESWEEAIVCVQKVYGDSYEGMGEHAWSRFARSIYARGVDGKPRLTYDPAIAEGLRAAVQALRGGGAVRVPHWWGEFGVLASLGVPLVLVYGVLTEVVPVGLIGRMREVAPELEVVSVGGRGHAPFMDEPEAEAALDRFLARL